MAIHIRSHASRFQERRDRNEFDVELGHVRDLERLRSILERYGVTKAELRAYDVEIERHRRDLAVLAGPAFEPHLSAA